MREIIKSINKQYRDNSIYYLGGHGRTIAWYSKQEFVDRIKDAEIVYRHKVIDLCLLFYYDELLRLARII